jgi:hypothetical protein
LRLTGLLADADLRLMDDQGYDIYTSAEVGVTDEVIALPVGPGAYYAEVYFYEEDTNYELLASGAPAEAPAEDSGGDSVETASDLGLLSGEGFTVEEWVGPIDNDDFFAFEIASRTRTTFRLDSFQEDLDIFVMDERGQTIGSGELTGSEPEEVVLSLRPGRYVARVQFFGSVGSDYRLVLSPYGSAN